MQFRVPADRLDEALSQIKNNALEVRNESISGQDITADYVDLQARLRSLESAESQLEEMMQDAQDMTDVINIFNQLTDYRQQIEQVKGQMQYYEQAVALSSVNITLLAEEGVLPLEIGGWKLGRETRSAIQDLIYFLQGFLRFMIRFFIYFLPVMLFSLIPIYIIIVILRFIWRMIRGKDRLSDFFTANTWQLRRRAAETPPAEDAEA